MNLQGDSNESEMTFTSHTSSGSSGTCQLVIADDKQPAQYYNNNAFEQHTDLVD